MNTIAIDEIKSYLRIDTNLEDALLALFLFSAQSYLENYLGRTLAEIKGTALDYPWPIKVWVVSAVGQMYNRREDFDFDLLPHNFLSHYKTIPGWGFGDAPTTKTTTA